MPCGVAGVRAAVDDTNKTAKRRIYPDTPAKPRLRDYALALCNTLASVQQEQACNAANCCADGFAPL